MAGSVSVPKRILQVLDELDMNARDRIVNCLKSTGGRDLKATRESCRALRQLVDGSLRDVRVGLGREDMELFKAGAYFPLRRWPRCSGVTIKLNGADQLASDPSLTGDLLSLPFMGLSPMACRRIHNLRIDLGYQRCQSVSLPGASLSSLLRSLPALQRVSINGGMPVEPYQQQLMYDALASLPYLEELELPVCRTLDGLGGLAGSERLRKLSLMGSVIFNELDAAMVAGITSLTHLQELSVTVRRTPNSIIARLLRRLPPSVRALELRNCSLLNPPVYKTSNPILHFEHGRVVVMVNSCCAGSFVRFMDEVLQPSGVLGQQLRRVRLEVVILGDLEEQQLEPAAISRVRELLHDRCDEVEVGCMCVECDVPPQDILMVMDMLGTVPRELHLPMAGGIFTIQLRLQPPEQGPPPPPQANSSSVSPQAPSLMELAVEALVGGVPAEAGQAPSMRVEAAGLRDSSSNSSYCSVQQYEPHLLLLHGPAMAVMAWAPKALRGWMEKLAERVEAAAPQGDGGAGGGTARRLVGYLPLPGTPAVLLQCTSAAAATTLAGVVRTAAAAETAGGHGADRQLRVLRVVGEGLWDADTVFVHAVDKAAHKLVDSGGGSVRQRLQRLLEGWDKVQWVQSLSYY